MTLSTDRYCSRCGAANPSHTSVCFACGVSLKATVPLYPESAEQNARLALHQVFKGRYRILSQVGTGGFGAVYKAEDLQENNRLVAIKEIRLDGLSPQQVIDATDAFNREVHLLSNLHHPNIPRIYEQLMMPQEWYLVMDFIEGVTLEDYRAGAQNGKLPIEQVLSIGIQLCSTLEYLHSQQPPIIYRDLKPSNVMLTADDHLYLIDFGVARHFKRGKARDTIAFGSPGYAAPEQYGRAQTTAQSDLYSLGATLHNLLTGLDPAQSPFHFEPLHLPKKLAACESLILQMVEMEADRRPASASFVKQQLQQFALQQTGGKLHTLSSTIRGQLVPPPQSLPTFSTRGVTLYIHRVHTSQVHTLAWSPDSLRIASAGHAVQVWDALTGEHLYYYQNHSGAVNDVAWSPDGRSIASAGSDSTVQVWDVVSRPVWLRSLAQHMGFKYTTFWGHAKSVNAVAFSPDGVYLASAGEDGGVYLWHVPGGKLITKLHSHTDIVYALAWSADNHYLASTSQDHRLNIWELSTKKKISIPHKSASVINTVAWSPDNRLLALGDNAYKINLWDITTQQQFRLLQGHKGRIHALSWSPDGKFIASASSDQTVNIWEIATGTCIYTYKRHISTVYDVAWSPNGQYIASASGGMVHVWQAS